MRWDVCAIVSRDARIRRSVWFVLRAAVALLWLGFFAEEGRGRAVAVVSLSRVRVWRGSHLERSGRVAFEATARERRRQIGLSCVLGLGSAHEKFFWAQKSRVYDARYACSAFIEGEQKQG